MRVYYFTIGIFNNLSYYSISNRFNIRFVLFFSEGSATINETNICSVSTTTLESGISSTIIEENMGQLGLGDTNSKDVIVNLESENISKCIIKAATSNRRYTLRPQKRLQNTEYAVTPMKKSLQCKKKNTCLETIFEDPQHKNGSIILLGRALKRSIAFNDSINLSKVKRRRLKIKRLSKNNKKKAIKITLEDVKRKLKCLEECEDDEWMDISEPPTVS